MLEGVEVFVSSDKGIKTGDKWEERITEKGAVSEELEIYQGRERRDYRVFRRF